MFVRSGHYDKGHIEIVEKVTPSGRFVLKSGTYDPNGRKRGQNSWYSTWATLATEDQIAGVYRNGLVAKFKAFDWSKLPPDDLKAVNVIVSKHSP
jgi:hypothetical protein